MHKDIMVIKIELYALVTSKAHHMETYQAENDGYGEKTNDSIYTIGIRMRYAC